MEQPIQEDPVGKFSRPQPIVPLPEHALKYRSPSFGALAIGLASIELSLPLSLVRGDGGSRWLLSGLLFLFALTIFIVSIGVWWYGRRVVRAHGTLDRHTWLWEVAARSHGAVVFLSGAYMVARVTGVIGILTMTIC